MVLHSDPGALFKPFVRDELMDKMTSGEGQLYDPGSDTWYYYYSFTNPDWFVIFRVDNATPVNLTRHETNLVIGGSLSQRSLLSCSVFICVMLPVPC